MKDSLKDMAYRAGSRAGGVVSSTLSRAVELGQALKPDAKDVKQATDWVKATASSTAEEAGRMGKEAMKSDLVKDAAAGAGIGAVVAVPIPVIGPIAGAVIGAGLGIYKNLSQSKSATAVLPPQTHAVQPAATTPAPEKDLYTELTKLDELRQRDILTQEEFDVQKKKLLG